MGRILLGLGWIACGAVASAVDDDEELPPKVDPYTKGDAARIAKAGYLRLGEEMLLAKGQRGAQVEEVLGAKWMLWAETEHFKIGSRLGARDMPVGDREALKKLKAELDELRAKGLDLPRKVKELDPWITLHLFAHRLEALYGDVETMLGVTDATFPAPDAVTDRRGPGPYLGAHGKFVVLMFDQKADLARYLGRFAGRELDQSYRYLSVDDDVNLFATAREGYSTSEHEESWFRCHVTGNLIRSFASAYRGYRYNLPLWWVEGWAHWTTRRLDPTYFSPTVAQGQDADWRKDSEWEDKVYGRVKNDYYPKSSDLMTKGDPRDFAFADHLMSWSRVDFLLSRADAKPGAFMDRMKSLPWTGNTTFEEVVEVQADALDEGWGLDYDAIDAAWVEWVLEEYHPRKRKSRKR